MIDAIFFFFGVALNLFEFFLSNTGFFIFIIIFLKNLNNTSDQGESLIKLSHQFESLIFLENERLIDGLFIHLFFNGLIDDLGLVYTHTHIFFLKGVPSLHNVNRDNQSHSNMKGSTKFAIKVSLLSSPYFGTANAKFLWNQHLRQQILPSLFSIT